jgi:hypothetical protein
MLTRVGASKSYVFFVEIIIKGAVDKVGAVSRANYCCKPATSPTDQASRFPAGATVQQIEDATQGAAAGRDEKRFRAAARRYLPDSPCNIAPGYSCTGKT